MRNFCEKNPFISWWNFYFGKRKQPKIIWGYFLLSFSPLLLYSWEGLEVGWKVGSKGNLQIFSSLDSRLSWQQATFFSPVPPLGFGSALGPEYGRREKEKCGEREGERRGEWEEKGDQRRGEGCWAVGTGAVPPIVASGASWHPALLIGPRM